MGKSARLGLTCGCSEPFTTSGEDHRSILDVRALWRVYPGSRVPSGKEFRENWQERVEAGSSLAPLDFICQDDQREAGVQVPLPSLAASCSL